MRTRSLVGEPPGYRSLTRWNWSLPWTRSPDCGQSATHPGSRSSRIAAKSPRTHASAYRRTIVSLPVSATRTLPTAPARPSGASLALSQRLVGAQGRSIRATRSPDKSVRVSRTPDQRPYPWLSPAMNWREKTANSTMSGTAPMARAARSDG